MKYSKVQVDLWRTRERLSLELAGMSASQMDEHFRQVLADFEARTGKRLKVVRRPKRGRLPVRPPQ